MNDADQRLLTGRLAMALGQRIAASLSQDDTATAQGDIRHLLRLQGHADDALFLTEIKRIESSWPEKDDYLPALRDEVRVVESRMQRLTQERQIAISLQRPHPQPLKSGVTLGKTELARIQAAAEAEQVWPFEPPFAGYWTVCGPRDLVREAELVHRALSGEAFFDSIFAGRIMAGRVCSLSCYGAAMVEFLLADEQGNADHSAVFMTGTFGVLPIEGTSPRIHALNANGHLDLSTADKALEYLRFFCGVVQGEEGPFTIISDPPEVAAFVRNPTAPASLPEMPDIAAPLVSAVENELQEPEGQQSVWHIAACLAHGNAVFAAEFDLQRGGMVTMLEDQPMYTDLPITQPRFTGGLRRLSPVAERQAPVGAAE